MTTPQSGSCSIKPTPYSGWALAVELTVLVTLLPVGQARAWVTSTPSRTWRCRSASAGWGGRGRGGVGAPHTVRPASLHQVAWPRLVLVDGKLPVEGDIDIPRLGWAGPVRACLRASPGGGRRLLHGSRPTWAGSWASTTSPAGQTG
jgi:hypothetical protein